MSDHDQECGRYSERPSSEIKSGFYIVEPRDTTLGSENHYEAQPDAEKALKDKGVPGLYIIRVTAVAKSEAQLVLTPLS